MARSHIKELVREAFELDEVVVDADGDLPFPCGTAMFYVSVIPGGRLLRVWSAAVSGIHVNKAVPARAQRGERRAAAREGLRPG
jgi:hypothetical protein